VQPRSRWSRVGWIAGLTLRLSTGWATPRQQDQTVTLRLSGKDESVLVGEFEVK
jgi:hypothetical protein